MDSEKLSPGLAFSLFVVLSLSLWGVLGTILWAVFKATHGGCQ